MINKNDFKIRKNVLVKYTGKDTEVHIPDCITVIGKGAFENCDTIKSVTLPNTIARIKPNAFDRCINLQKVNLPEGLQEIGWCAFKYCVSLTSIVIPNSVKVIGILAFIHCLSLRNVTLPNGISTIQRGVFCGCHSLENIIIPESVSVIEKDAFFECISLTKISLPKNIKKIEDYAFGACYRLVEVCNKSKLRLYKGSYRNGSVARSAKATYRNNFKSKLITTDDGFLIYVDGNTKSLVGYKGKENFITLPAGITKIDHDAFCFLSSIYRITIPKSVKEISSAAFFECYNLVEVFNKSSLDIECMPLYVKKVSKDFFETKIKITEDGYAIYEDGKTKCLVGYTGKEQDLTLPEGITEIGPRAFFKNPLIRSVIIPNGVTKICRLAFGDCAFLKNVVLPDTLIDIEDYAFSKCTSLENIILPESLRDIGDGAFENCESFSSIIIPKNITSIKSSFIDCDKMKSVTLPVSLVEVDSFAFCDDHSLDDIYYEGTTYQFKKIGNIKDMLTLIKDWQDINFRITIHCTDDDIILKND